MTPARKLKKVERHQARKKLLGRREYNDRQNRYRRAQKERDPALYLFRKARSRAERNGIPFTIELKDVVVPTHCPVLDIKLTFGKLHNPSSPSLDRRDNSKGYVRGNVVVISYRANILKKDATPKELAQLAEFFS